MIQITAQMRVLVAIEPVDGRKGIDSLARLSKGTLSVVLGPAHETLLITLYGRAGGVNK